MFAVARCSRSLGRCGIAGAAGPFRERSTHPYDLCVRGRLVYAVAWLLGPVGKEAHTRTIQVFVVDWSSQSLGRSVWAGPFWGKNTYPYALGVRGRSLFKLAKPLAVRGALSRKKHAPICSKCSRSRGLRVFEFAGPFRERSAHPYDLGVRGRWVFAVDVVVLVVAPIRSRCSRSLGLRGRWVAGCSRGPFGKEAHAHTV